MKLRCDCLIPGGDIFLVLLGEGILLLKCGGKILKHRTAGITSCCLLLTELVTLITTAPDGQGRKDVPRGTIWGLHGTVVTQISDRHLADSISGLDNCVLVVVAPNYIRETPG